jgi:predicted glycosyltransferase
LDEVYDRIFIYGTPEFFDPVSAYRFGRAAKDKTSFTGFIADSPHPPLSAATSNGNVKKVLLTIGGGEDGAEIVGTYIEMLAAYGERLNVETTAVLGPFMPESKRKAFTVQAQDLSLRVVEFVPELSGHLTEADLVISMGGYNTVVEILGAARKALIIPRIQPRKEQLLRARRLFEMGLVSYISPEELSPERLYQSVMSNLASPNSPLADARQKKLLPLDGAVKLTELCRTLLVQRGVLK